MARYYLDQTDDELTLWQTAFLHAAPAVLAGLGLDAGMLTPVTAAASAYAAALTDARQKAAAAAAAVTLKDEARDAATKQIAQLVRQLQAHPGLTDGQRASLGLKARDTILTAAPPPATPPLVMVDASQRLRHAVSFRDALERRGKPAGVMACELWLALAPAAGEPLATPLPPDAWRLVTVATRSPVLVNHAQADAGKMARYRCRWLNRKAQAGPWSADVDATVAG